MLCIDHGQKGSPTGYGLTKWNGRNMKLHRKVYCVQHGLSRDAIAGKHVRHTCDNPRCINPEHLVLGTHQDNMKDKKTRRRVAGERSPVHVLKERHVEVIRDLYSSGFTQVELAKLFKVSQPCISQVVNNHTWN